jgi:hypothetical protein
MGWSNFIIIEKLKMIIEINRNVIELEDYIKDAVGKMINNDIEIDIEISELKVSDITVKDLCTLASSYDNATNLYQLDIDKLFLYWLESRNIGYEIKSEYNIDITQYEENGYNIIRIHV